MARFMGITYVRHWLRIPTVPAIYSDHYPATGSDQSPAGFSGLTSAAG
jgi:hypothetical protein